MAGRVFQSPEAAAQALDAFARGHVQAIIFAMRSATKKARKRAAARTKTATTAARKIYGAKPGMPATWRSISPRYSQSSGQIVGGLKASGMAAHIEGGLRTKDHWIKPKGGGGGLTAGWGRVGGKSGGGYLHFKTKSGHWIKTKRAVRVRGSRLKKGGVGALALRLAATQLRYEAEDRLQDMIRKDF